MVVKLSTTRMDMQSIPIQNIEYQDINQVAAPGAPATSKVRVYAKSDGKVYRHPAGGAETELGGCSVLTTQGDILYRDASADARLAAGTSGFLLQTGGAAANPSWVDHNASAAVHGLPANVHVLGHRAGAGRFAQQGSGTGVWSGTSTFRREKIAISFSVAFSATPIVVCGGSGSLTGGAAAAGHLNDGTTTGITLSGYQDDSDANRTIEYLAVGT